MRKNLLLSSTAIVGAGVMFASAQPALADIELTISGQVEFGGVAASGDTLVNGERDRGYGFFMDSETNFNADGVTDSGLNYGAKVELEVDVANTFLSDGGNNADEVGLYFSGGWGRVEVGRDDGAEDVMFVGGEDAQAGTGGIDGDTANLTVVQIQDTGDSAKVTYFTPRLAGFQGGVSFTPDVGDNATKANNDFERDIGFGANWVGGIGPVDTTISAVGNFANREADGIDNSQRFDNKKDWSVGFLGEWGGLSFGAAGGQRKGFILAGEDNDTDFANVGIKYGFGPANVSVGYNWASFDNTDNQQVFGVSGDLGILPGVVLKADVTYNTEDPFEDDDDIGIDTDPTTSGVLTVQLNY